jgi:5'(3')-deoxyribonucleotidase
VKKQRICVDMDDTMADTLGEHIARYNAEFAANVCKADLHGKWLWEHVPEARRASLHDSMRSDGFFEDLDVLPDCARVMERLHEHYEIFVATAAMSVPTSFASKYRWLQRHFPFIPYERYVYCGDKSILLADYLVDDQPRFLARFSGHGVLFTAGHNVRETAYPRVENWLEVEQYFLPDGKARG